MTKRQVLVLGALVTIVLILVIIMVFANPTVPVPAPGASPGTVRLAPNQALTQESPIQGYSPEVPANAAPGAPEAQIAIPAQPGQPLRTFNVFSLVASRDGYSPSSVTVRRGDVIEINLSSEGGDFDLFSPSLGFYVFARRGETKGISFEVPVTGTFSLLCRDHCPSGGTMEGKLVVLP